MSMPKPTDALFTIPAPDAIAGGFDAPHTAYDLDRLDCSGLPTQAVVIYSEDQWSRLPAAARPEGAVRVPGVGRVLIRPVPRWEALADDPAPQPVPLETDITPMDAGQAMLTRYWEPEDVGHCRLCLRCNSAEAAQRPGKLVCLARVPASLSEADAPLYSAKPA